MAPFEPDFKLEDLLGGMDDDFKAAFFALSEEEKLFAMLNMQAYLRREIATVKKRQLSFEEDARRYRQYRERQERKISADIGDVDANDDDMSVTQKMMRVAAQEVAKAFANRFDFWIYFRDRVLPSILTTIALGILYLVFRGNIP